MIFFFSPQFSISYFHDSFPPCVWATMLALVDARGVIAVSWCDDSDRQYWKNSSITSNNRDLWPSSELLRWPVFFYSVFATSVCASKLPSLNYNCRVSEKMNPAERGEALHTAGHTGGKSWGPQSLSFLLLLLLLRTSLQIFGWQHCFSKHTPHVILPPPHLRLVLYRIATSEHHQIALALGLFPPVFLVESSWDVLSVPFAFSLQMDAVFRALSSFAYLAETCTVSKRAALDVLLAFSFPSAYSF